MKLWHVTYMVSGERDARTCISMGVDERAALCRVQAEYPLHTITKRYCLLIENGIAYL